MVWVGYQFNIIAVAYIDILVVINGPGRAGGLALRIGECQSPNEIHEHQVDENRT